MTRAQPDVVVAGAGPTGLVLAAELARRGTSVRIVDALPAPSPLSRAIVLHARTLEVLADLGLADRLIAAGTPLRRIALHSERAPLLEVGLGELDTPYPFLLSIPQEATEAVLTAHLRGLGVEVERPATVTSFEVSEEDRATGVVVTVQLDTGEAVRCRYLVGADGAHSAVRRGLGVPFDGHPYAEHLALGDVRWDTDLPRDAVASFLSADGFLAAFPLPDDRWRLIGVRAPTATGDDLGLAELQAAVDARTARGGRLWDPTWLAAFRIHARQVPQYRHGPVLLAGDAAHIHSPAGGQGMNLGIQDAHNLGWKLALVARGAPDSLLDSYHAERHPIAAATLVGTDLATRIGTARNPVVRSARDAAAGWLAGLSLVRRRVTRTLAELDVDYGASPIVSRSTARGWASHAGDRAPAGLGLDGDRHTAVLATGPGVDPDGARRLRACAAVLRGFPDVRIVERTDPELTRADAVWVVRPDLYVGYRGTPADPVALLGWCERVFGLSHTS
ncbi:MAG: FAD-dependent monooxygenase [Myxococcota bacterium]